MIGRRLSGRYKVQEMIGGGGMANVYLARDMILDRDVAVKVLRPDFSDDDEFIKRFHREAHSTTSLDHPNIVNIFDVGEEDDTYFFVMEYVEGKTLKQFIQQYGPISVEETIRIMKQISSAINHAHQNQIVHRDIKPHNILIDDVGTVKVTDFGIAMALSATSITQTNSVLGSVHYISPEQARGGMANNKSDIYSLGIVMFELLTGRLPFSGESAVSIAIKHLQSETPSPRRWNSSIPQSIENIVIKATAKDPFYRYENVEEMIHDLETALNEERLHEPKFVLPEDHEKTKAIPVITDDFQGQNQEDTIVHTPTQNSKPYQIEEPEKKKNKWILPFVTTGTIVLILAMLTIFFILPTILKEDDVIVPNLKGKEITEALTELQSLGLKVNTKQRHDADVSAGLVIQTDPAANSAVKKGFEITVYESLGKEKVEFGNYIGMQLSEAKRRLELKGVPEENINAYPKESDLPVNEIIVQGAPKPGEKINPDAFQNLTVFFEISKGPKLLMPDMKGWSEERVLKFVNENPVNLEYAKKQVYSNEYKANHVVAQSPKPETELEKGEHITITLSKGNEPKPYTVTLEIPFETSHGNTEQKVKIYVEDAENEMADLYKTETMTETKEISFEILVPYGGKASYKIYRNDVFYVSDEIKYERLP